MVLVFKFVPASTSDKTPFPVLKRMGATALTRRFLPQIHTCHLTASNLTTTTDLVATKIYLSGDRRFIKQLGAELGSSEDSDNCQFDMRFVCLLRKFQQHPHLKALLQSRNILQLVGATPDLFWGWGATLLANALRRHNWPGRNKHRAILMMVRVELLPEVKTHVKYKIHRGHGGKQLLVTNLISKT